MSEFSWRLSAAVTLACLCVVVSISALAAQGSKEADKHVCATRTTDLPVLSPDSIGYLHVDEQLGRLRNLCGTARDTTAGLGGAAGPAYPGLVFAFDSLTVIALQYGQSALSLGRAADGWIVSGTRATIQHKVALSASWSELYHALGPAQANIRGVLAVRFCSFPNAILTLNVDPAAVARQGERVDLASIPPGATIHHLFIMSRSLASHLMGC